MPRRTLALVEKSYSVVSAPDAAAMLGCSAAELTELARHQGWVQEQDGGKTYFRIPPPTSKPEIALTPNDLDRFNRYVLHLES